MAMETPSLGTQTPRKNGRGVWAPGLPGCVSVRRDVGVPVIAIMTVYDVCMRHNYSSASVRLGEACTQSGGERAVTENEVMACEKYRCRCCGRIIADSRERRLLHSDANTEARELLTELLATAYSGRKSQEEALVLLGAESKTASYICRSPCFASLQRVLRARERLKQLQQDLHKEESNITDQLKQLYVTEVQHVCSPKRPRLEEVSPPGVHSAVPRYLCFDEKSSPSVSVSLSTLY